MSPNLVPRDLDPLGPHLKWGLKLLSTLQRSSSVGKWVTSYLLKGSDIGALFLLCFRWLRFPVVVVAGVLFALVLFCFALLCFALLCNATGRKTPSGEQHLFRLLLTGM